MTGGEDSFGSGGYSQTRIEKIMKKPAIVLDGPTIAIVSPPIESAQMSPCGPVANIEAGPL